MTTTDVIADELRAVAAELTIVLCHAGDLAAELADLEARRRCALNAAGERDPRPDARALAADVALGYLSALRPHLAFVTRESADRAAEELTVSGEVKTPVGKHADKRHPESFRMSGDTRDKSAAFVGTQKHYKGWPFR